MVLVELNPQLTVEARVENRYSKHGVTTAYGLSIWQPITLGDIIFPAPIYITAPVERVSAIS